MKKNEGRGKNLKTVHGADTFHFITSLGNFKRDYTSEIIVQLVVFGLYYLIWDCPFERFGLLSGRDGYRLVH